MPDVRRQKTETIKQINPRDNFQHPVIQNPVIQTPSILSAPSSATYLAFDFGIKRIGIATGNTLVRRAHPLTTISEEKTEARFAKIAALIAEWQPGTLVVGLPCNDDGTPHELTALSRRFANRLKGRFNLPVILIDERYTSHAASAQLNEEGIHGKKQKALVDQYAAQQILQAYFDELSVDTAHTGMIR